MNKPVVPGGITQPSHALARVAFGVALLCGLYACGGG